MFVPFWACEESAKILPSTIYSCKNLSKLTHYGVTHHIVDYCNVGNSFGQLSGGHGSTRLY